MRLIAIIYPLKLFVRRCYSMGIFERMLNTQALMFIYVMTGIIMAKTKILKHEGRSSFIKNTAWIPLALAMGRKRARLLYFSPFPS